MSETNAVIIVGGVVEQDGKFLLVQEAKPSCYGKWNLPAGHLDIGEDIFEGARREIREETGRDVELVGVCQIGNRKRKDLAFVSIIFLARLVNNRKHFDINHHEILDTKWFTYEEIIAMRENIRNTDLLIGAIENYRNNIVAPLRLVKVYHEGAEFQANMVREDDN